LRASRSEKERKRDREREREREFRPFRVNPWGFSGEADRKHRR